MMVTAFLVLWLQSRSAKNKVYLTLDVSSLLKVMKNLDLLTWVPTWKNLETESENLLSSSVWTLVASTTNNYG